MKGYDDFFAWLENNDDAQDALERRQLDLMVDFAMEHGFDVSIDEVVEFLDSLEDGELEDWTQQAPLEGSRYLN